MILKIDTKMRVVGFRGQVSERLTLLEFLIFIHVACTPSPTSKLLERFWSRGDKASTGKLHMHISNIRKKIESLDLDIGKSHGRYLIHRTGEGEKDG